MMNQNRFTRGLLAGLREIFALVGKVNLSLIRSNESNVLRELMVDLLWKIYEFVWLGVVAPALDENVFCKHSMWISTCTFLGCTHKHRHCRHHRHLIHMQASCFPSAACLFFISWEKTPYNFPKNRRFLQRRQLPYLISLQYELLQIIYS